MNTLVLAISPISLSMAVKCHVKSHYRLCTSEQTEYHKSKKTTLQGAPNLTKPRLGCSERASDSGNAIVFSLVLIVGLLVDVLFTEDNSKVS